MSGAKLLIFNRNVAQVRFGLQFNVSSRFISDCCEALHCPVHRKYNLHAVPQNRNAADMYTAQRQHGYGT